jgi:hypothetical protein
MTASEISDASKYMRHDIEKELRIGTWNMLQEINLFLARRQ